MEYGYQPHTLPGAYNYQFPAHVEVEALAVGEKTPPSYFSIAKFRQDKAHISCTVKAPQTNGTTDAFELHILTRDNPADDNAWRIIKIITQDSPAHFGIEYVDPTQQVCAELVSQANNAAVYVKLRQS